MSVMNSILVRTDGDPARSSAGRILVIEPDVERASFLRGLLTDDDGFDLRIVKSAQDAMRSITRQVPDLVMTSTFLPPADEAALADQLKQTVGASHLQIINVPYFIDGIESPVIERPRSRMRGLWRRRSVPPRPRCDRDTLRRQIKEYLDRAITDRALAMYESEADAASLAPKSALWLAVSRPQPVASGPAVCDPLSLSAEQRDRRRARRRRSSELPSLWAVRLPGGSEVKVVDISNRGALLESAFKIAPGSTIDLQVLGEETNVVVPSRAVRSDVAAVDGFGVRYHIAATFSRELDLAGLERPSAPPPSPRELGDLLARVLADADGVDSVSRPTALRARFESELRALLRVRDIRLRDTPTVAEPGVESIYFTVPHGAAGASSILQVLFDPGSTPSRDEFRLLKASASLAAVVLDFAPRSPALPAWSGR
jgi:CheY-like chemotaxis protein